MYSKRKGTSQWIKTTVDTLEKGAHITGLALIAARRPGAEKLYIPDIKGNVISQRTVSVSV